MTEDINGRIRKSIINETTITVAIALAVFGFVNWATSPVNQLRIDVVKLQSNIDYLKENHLRHIEDDIKNTKEDIKMINSRLDKQYDVSYDNNRILRKLIGEK